MSFRSLFTLLCLSSVLNSMNSVQAAEQLTPEPAVNSISPESMAMPKMKLTLEKLRTIGLDLRQVLKATDTLYQEVTQPPVNLDQEPEDISKGFTVSTEGKPADKSAPSPTYAQPEKQRVDQAMNSIRPVITSMKRDVDAFRNGDKGFDVTNEVRVRIEPDLERFRDGVNDIAAQMEQLESLTKTPPYKNADIAQTVLKMKTDIKSLDEARRDIYRAVRREKAY